MRWNLHAAQLYSCKYVWRCESFNNYMSTSTLSGAEDFTAALNKGKDYMTFISLENAGHLCWHLNSMKILKIFTLHYSSYDVYSTFISLMKMLGWGHNATWQGEGNKISPGIFFSFPSPIICSAKHCTQTLLFPNYVNNIFRGRIHGNLIFFKGSASGNFGICEFATFGLVSDAEPILNGEIARKTRVSKK